MKKALLPILIAILVPLAAADNNPVNSIGIQPNYAYKGGINEVVNLFNGNLHVGVPLLTLKGRAGFDLNVALSYNSRQFKYWTDDFGYKHVEWIDQRDNLGRWSGFFAPSITEWSEDDGYGWYQRFAEVTLETGATTFFAEDWGYGTGLAQDGTLMQYDFDQKILMAQSGIWHDFSEAASNYRIRKADANGNYQVFQYNTGWTLTQITDSLGRSVNFYYDSAWPHNHTPTRMTVLNNGGSTLTYTFQYQMKSLNTAPYGYYPYSGTYSFRVLSQIGLPDGTSWNFHYHDGYPNAGAARLERVTYPTGGYTRYEYSHNSGDSGLDFHISKKSANANNGQGEISTQYTIFTVWNGLGGSIITNPDGSYEEHQMQDGHDNAVYFYDALGTALKCDLYSWWQFEPFRGTKLHGKRTYFKQPSGQWALYVFSEYYYDGYGNVSYEYVHSNWGLGGYVPDYPYLQAPFRRRIIYRNYSQIQLYRFSQPYYRLHRIQEETVNDMNSSGVSSDWPETISQSFSIPPIVISIPLTDSLRQ